MPNHVTTRITITGPNEDLQKFKTSAIKQEVNEQTKEPYRFIDFNAAVPMPSFMADINESTLSGDVLTIMLRSGGMVAAWQNLQRFDKAGHMGDWKGLAFYDSGDIEKRLELAFPGCVKDARLMARAIAETGHRSWYDWSIANWGTKWNSYDFSVVEDGGGRLIVEFDTAWSFAHPVWRKFAETFPTLRFDAVAFDEGWNFATKGHAQGGAYQIEDVDATEELYIEVYGHAPERDEEETVH